MKIRYSLLLALYSVSRTFFLMSHTFLNYFLIASFNCKTCFSLCTVTSCRPPPTSAASVDFNYGSECVIAPSATDDSVLLSHAHRSRFKSTCTRPKYMYFVLCFPVLWFHLPSVCVPQYRIYYTTYLEQISHSLFQPLVFLMGVAPGANFGPWTGRRSGG